MKNGYLVFFLLILTFQPVLYALDEPERGRLPDGRAFRTDSQGNQLVDYIAELEVSIEALNRKVAGLEDELKEKESKLAGVVTGGASAAGIKERNLIIQSDQNAAECPRIECPPATVACPAQTEDFSFTEAEALRSRLEIERDLSTKQATSLKASVTRLEGQLSQRDGEIAALKKRLQTIATNEEQKSIERSAEREAVKALEERTRALQASAEASQSMLALKEEEISGLKRMLSDTEGLLGKTRAALREAESRVRASLEEPSSQARPAGINEKVSSDVRSRALDAARSTLREDLADLKRLVALREESYKEYTQRPRPLMFKLSPLVSARGVTFKDLPGKIEGASSVRELSLYGHDLNGIRSKVKADLELMQRVGQMGQ